MIFKGNPQAEKEFARFNFQKSGKRLLGVFAFLTVFMLFIGYFVLKKDSLFQSKTMALIFIGSELCLVPFMLIILYFTTKKLAKNLGSWELQIEDNYAVLKNPSALVKVCFADFIKYKEDSQSITFYLKGLRRFYINWFSYYEPEKLKETLRIIAGRIGTYKKEDLPLEFQKTKVEFNSKKRKSYLFLVIVVIVLQVISHLFLK